jgi:acyl-CoA reductase-like NAD-dependent aldehyde dehydrogenase
MAVQHIMSSKTFDYGTVCSSEQAIVTEDAIVEEVKRVIRAQGGYFLEGEKAEKIKSIMVRQGGGMNPAIVGKPAKELARIAGIEIPAETRLLVFEEQGVGPGYPFSYEKLTALIGFYSVPDWQAAADLCTRLLKNGGLGHSLAVHSNDKEVIRHFGLHQPVSRVLVNSPSTQGAVGLSTNLDPSFTLGCGAVGGSSTSDNVGAQHLFNVRYLAHGLENFTVKNDDKGSIDIDAITDLVIAQLKNMNLVSTTV